MKSLKTIQTFAKMGKIFSKIVFVASLVGASVCLLSLIKLAILSNTSFEIEGMTFAKFVESEGQLSMASVYASLIVAIIACGAEIFLAKKAEIYFNHELAIGTPFDEKVAKELKMLGVFCIVVGVCVEVISMIVLAIIRRFNEGITNFDNYGSFWLGLTLIVFAILCEYGSEIKDNKLVNKEENIPEEKSNEE